MHSKTSIATWLSVDSGASLSPIEWPFRSERKESEIDVPKDIYVREVHSRGGYSIRFQHHILSYSTIMICQRKNSTCTLDTLDVYLHRMFEGGRSFTDLRKRHDEVFGRSRARWKIVSTSVPPSDSPFKISHKELVALLGWRNNLQVSSWIMRVTNRRPAHISIDW